MNEIPTQEPDTPTAPKTKQPSVITILTDGFQPDIEVLMLETLSAIHATIGVI